MNLQNELFAFRTAYLKAIAKSWNDEAFKSKVVSSDGTAKNLLEIGEFTKLLSKKTPMDWGVDVAVVEDEKIPGYNPYNLDSNAGWPGGADIMVVKIPKKPSEKESVCAEAIASFYSENTTIFSSKKGATPSAMKSVEEVKDLFKYANYTVENYEAALEADLGNEMGDAGNNLFLSFGSVVMNMIGRAWAEPMYLNYLKENPFIEPVGQEGAIVEDEFMSFENPWGFRIKFELDETATWNEAEGEWENLSKNQIYLMFPAKPQEGYPNAQALMRYNNTGPAYPLTCAI